MAAPKMDEILKMLEEGVTDIFSSERYRKYLEYLSKFHRYSARNVIWLFLQNPDITRVAGYSTWKNLGRHVKKGEKSLFVLAPTPYKQQVEQKVIDPATKKPGTEMVEVVRQAFRPVPVFDVSQTEGKPLPRLSYELDSNIQNFRKMMDAVLQLSPVPVEIEAINSGNGYFNFEEKRIGIKEGLSQAQTIKTAIHEVAHAVLHDIDLTPDKKVVASLQKDRATIEVEAESVAFVVCQHFGVDTSDYSFGYLAGWSRNKDIPQLKASLETIRCTASQFITFLDEHLALEPVQEQAKEITYIDHETIRERVQALHDSVMAAKINNHAGNACHAVTVKRLRRMAEQIPTTDKLRPAVLVAASSPNLEVLKNRMEKLVEKVGRPEAKKQKRFKVLEIKKGKTKARPLEKRPTFVQGMGR